MENEAETGATAGSNSLSNASGDAKDHQYDNTGANSPSSLPDLATVTLDRTLHFLSHASNETLGACIVGLGAVTYFVFGRIGLVLIGGVAGVALHATWEGQRGGNSESKAQDAKRRHEIGLEVAKRVLDWRERHNILTSIKKDDEDYGSRAGHTADFSGFKPQTRKALEALSDAVIKDYVRWWYSPILPEDVTFPSACRRVWTQFVVSLTSNISQKRPADAFVEYVTNSSSIFIVFLNELSSAIAASPGSETTRAVQSYVDGNPYSRLANIIDRKQQARQFQIIADDVLESNLDAQVYRCTPARIFLREIFSNIVLETTLQKCSTAEFINDWIVYLLEEGEPELLNVIDAGVEKSGAPEVAEVKELAATETELKSPQPKTPESTRPSHNRRVSRAEQAMEEAMREAQRLTQMIQEEEAERQRKQVASATVVPVEDDTSDSATQDVYTPASSESEKNSESAPAAPVILPPTASPPRTVDPQKDDSPPQQSPFTSFDQLAGLQLNNGFGSVTSSLPRQQDVLTLYRANITLIDDSSIEDRRPLKAKPAGDYLIQVEPKSSNFPGWMIVRTYSDLEALHEILRRIAPVSGATNFVQAHASLPFWRGLTAWKLRDELERYLADALNYEPLAESEGMKKFLEKERGSTRVAESRGGLGQFTVGFESVGKGMLNVATGASKGIAGGGKAVIGGVSSVFGARAPVERQNSQPGQITHNVSPSGITQISHTRSQTAVNASSSGTSPAPPQNRNMSVDMYSRPAASPRPSLDSRRSYQSQSGPSSPETRQSSSADLNRLVDGQVDRSRSPARRPPMGPSIYDTASGINLPPPPSDMPEDFTWHKPRGEPSSQMSADGTYFCDVPASGSDSLVQSPSVASPSYNPKNPSNTPRTEQPPPKPPRPPVARTASKEYPPLSEQEGQVTIELLFAVITELYNLSSAWNIRRTLLSAAKTYLLRPGNPQLESIRNLIQKDLLDGNFGSDAGLAGHILKLRENVLPTEEELKKWPKERSPEEKEMLRVKARRLLCERGMPAALTSVMGIAASSEALGKVFDVMQMEEVSRGLVFWLIVQAVRAMVA